MPLADLQAAGFRAASLNMPRTDVIVYFFRLLRTLLSNQPYILYGRSPRAQQPNVTPSLNLTDLHFLLELSSIDGCACLNNRNVMKKACCAHRQCSTSKEFEATDVPTLQVLVCMSNEKLSVYCRYGGRRAFLSYTSSAHPLNHRSSDLVSFDTNAQRGQDTIETTDLDDHLRPLRCGISCIVEVTCEY